MKEIRCMIHIQSDISEDSETHEGLRQGDGLACLLFNLALESAVWESGVPVSYTHLDVYKRQLYYIRVEA